MDKLQLTGKAELARNSGESSVPQDDRNKSQSNKPAVQSDRRRRWYPAPVLCLENPMDRGAWWAAVHGVAKSRIRLSDFTFTFLFPALEKEMATHSSVLAWRIPGTGEPGGLRSMGWHRVGHDWSDAAAAAVRYFRDICWSMVPKSWNFTISSMKQNNS